MLQIRSPLLWLGSITVLEGLFRGGYRLLRMGMMMGALSFFFLSTLYGKPALRTLKLIFFISMVVFMMVGFRSLQHLWSSCSPFSMTFSSVIIKELLYGGVLNDSRLTTNFTPIVRLTKRLKLLLGSSLGKKMRYCTVNTRVMSTGQHQQPAVSFVADWALSIHFVEQLVKTQFVSLCISN